MNDNDRRVLSRYRQMLGVLKPPVSESDFTAHCVNTFQDKLGWSRIYGRDVCGLIWREFEHRDDERLDQLLVEEGLRKKSAIVDGWALHEDAVVSFGSAVKAIGNGRTQGWLVEFTDPTRPDLESEYFDRTTDYGPHTLSLAFYHHGADQTLGRRPLKNAAMLDMRAVGVWMEHQLELRDDYEAAIYRLAEQGKLGLSSGTAPHLVERERKGDVYHITRWPLGLDASYTPTPANWQSRVMPLKSYIKSVGSAPLDVGVNMLRSQGLARARKLIMEIRASRD